MKIKMIFPLLAIAGLVFTLIYISSASSKTPKQVPLAEPVLVPFDKYIGAAGITEPNTENISIGTNKAGIVRSVSFEVGQFFKKDDVLFVIENSEAQAQLAQTQAEFKNAQDQYNTIASLNDKRAVSKDERNQKTNNLALAKAKLDMTAAALELYTVRAPIDGVVLSSNVRVGEFASSGALAEPLVRMGNIKPMHLRVDIDENDSWRFQLNSKAVAYVRGNNEIKADVQFLRVEPYIRPKKSLTGDSSERVDTRVLQVIYSFDPKDLPIFPGQQMDVYIEDLKK